MLSLLVVVENKGKVFFEDKISEWVSDDTQINGSAHSLNPYSTKLSPATLLKKSLQLQKFSLFE
jgi:hypothetical protein